MKIIRPVNISIVPIEVLSDAELMMHVKGYSTDEEIRRARLYEQAAIQRFLKEASYVIGEQAFEAFDIGFNDCKILYSVVSNVVVKYYDSTNTLQPLDTSLYELELHIDGTASIIYIGTLPTDVSTTKRNVVKYEIAIGTAIENIDALVKQAITQSIIYWFDNPSEAKKIYPSSFDYVIDIFRKTWV